ncbi:hypothetical protein FBU30_004479 [Linnemannia zychae]|nr:hypothetical protein FBU30_004479 [Linnemannia zychae]
MNGIYPVCYTVNGAYIYAAAYDTRSGRGQARVIIAQSPYYPTALNDTFIWDTIGEAAPQSYIRAMQFGSFTYNCAWNNDTSTFMLLGQDLRTISYATNRFGIEVATVFSPGVTVPPTKHEPLPFSKFETDYYTETIADGKSVVMPVMSGKAQSNGVKWISGVWIHAQMNVTSNQLLLRTYRGDLPFPEVPQVRWNMDRYVPVTTSTTDTIPTPTSTSSSTSSPTSSSIPSPTSSSSPDISPTTDRIRAYRLLAHSNNQLFVVGSKKDTNGLVITTLPFNLNTLATKPVSAAQPEIWNVNTIDSDMGAECNLDHPWSTASSYNGQLYVLCYPKAEDGSKTAFSLYTFNGKVVQKAASVISQYLSTESTPDHGPRFVPIPSIPSSYNPASGSTWALLSLNFGQRGYKVDLMGFTTPGGLGGIITIDSQTLWRPFTIDPSVSKYLKNDIYNIGESAENGLRKISAATWVGIFFGSMSLIFLIAKLVHYYRVREKEARRREAIANGMDPDMNPETVGGVTRTLYDQDASDDLPLYTLRAPHVPFVIQQPTATTNYIVYPSLGSASVTASGITAASTIAPVATVAHQAVQVPEPTDLPPDYSPDPNRPITSIEQSDVSQSGPQQECTTTTNVSAEPNINSNSTNNTTTEPTNNILSAPNVEHESIAPA